jgi:hypothetical protein
MCGVDDNRSARSKLVYDVVSQQQHRWKEAVEVSLISKISVVGVQESEEQS